MLKVFSLVATLIGFAFGMALYGLIYLHSHAYFNVIIFAMKKRVGREAALAWSAVGLVILYNLCFNHFFAMITKPGSPKDLIKIEEMRRKLKNRESR